MTAFDDATRRFLHVGTRTPKPLPDGVATSTLRVRTSAAWPDGPELALRVHVRGRGPAALLVHGWRSQAADLDGLSSMLADAGFSVWMPDLPGHGHSEGEHLGMPLAAAALHAVQAASGPFAVAVAHSYGGAGLVHALAGGLAADRVAVLAAPTHYGRFARRAARQAGMPDALVEPWLEHLHTLMDCHPDEIDMVRQADGLSQPALLVHSRDDPVAPFEGLAEVAAAWRGATWRPRDGLGHFRVLSDPGVLDDVRAFAVGDRAG